MLPLSILHFRLLSGVQLPLLTLVVIGTIFDYLIKFFQGKRFARKPWGLGDYSSRLSREPDVASVFNERFHLLSALVQKALWHSSTLSLPSLVYL